MPPTRRDRTRRMKFNHSTAAIILMLCMSLVASYAQGDEVDRMTNEALMRSGLARQLTMLPATIVTVLPDDAFRDGNMRRESAAFVKQTVGKERLLATVREAITMDLNRDALEKVLEFYRSGLGKKVGLIQGRALGESSLQQIREGRKATALMDEARVAVLERIIKAEHLSEANSRLLDQVVNGLADGILKHSGTRAEKVREDLRSLIERNPSLDDHTDAVALVAFARTYKSLSDRELEKLAEYHESEQAEWFRTAVQRGLEEAVYLTARSLGEVISSSDAPSAANGRSTR